MNWTSMDLADAYRRLGMEPPASEAPKANKYGARRKEVDGIVFDSAKEAHVYVGLKLMEACGKIHCLERQKVFLLQDPFRDDAGKRHRAITYRADFVYSTGKPPRCVVVECKGFKTPVWRMKEKMFRARYPNIRLEVV